MNSYSLDLIYSWWFAPIILLFSIGFSYFTYKNTLPPLPNFKKWLLIFLRSIGISLLLFILLEPVFVRIYGEFVKPKIFMMLDNSSSVAAQDARYNRKEQYNTAFENTGFLNYNKSNLSTAIFDNNIKEISSEKFAFDSLKFDGQETELSKVFRHISLKEESQNYRSIVLFTDGAFNAGNNPIYDAVKTGLPVFIVGIGDTNEPKDVSIQSLITNDIGYIDNKIPINVNFKSNGFDNIEVKVVLKDNEAKISEQTVKIIKEKSNYTLFFDFIPKSEGMHKLTVSIDPLPNEITIKNNSISEFVNVLKNKRKIALFAGAPSSDLSFFKNSLTSEKGLEIDDFIQKQGAEFYKTPTEKDLKDAQMIVMIGFPISSTPSNLMKMIERELSSGKPLLFVAGNQTDYSQLNSIKNHIPFSVISTNQREYQAFGYIKENSNFNSILKINGSSNDFQMWNKLPPIYKTETFVKLKPEAEVVMGLKVNDVDLNEPLMLSSNFQNHKCFAILGYGLYRWRMIGYGQDLERGKQDATDLLKLLYSNTLKWLWTDNQSKFVEIKTTKKNYSGNENIEFIAQVYDDTYSPIDNANVKIQISSGKENIETSLNSIGNGRYTASIANITKGDYFYKGSATLGTKTLGNDDGRFYKGETSLEYQNLKMNYELLSEIAKQTGGKFYFAENVKSLINDIQNHKSFKENAISKQDKIRLWNYPFILLLAIICFSLEWFLRKRSGLV